MVGCQGKGAGWTDDATRMYSPWRHKIFLCLCDVNDQNLCMWCFRAHVWWFKCHFRHWYSSKHVSNPPKVGRGDHALLQGTVIKFWQFVYFRCEITVQTSCDDESSTNLPLACIHNQITAWCFHYEMLHQSTLMFLTTCPCRSNKFISGGFNPSNKYMSTWKSPQFSGENSKNIWNHHLVNIDTRNDGLEKADSFKIWPFLVGFGRFSCEPHRFQAEPSCLKDHLEETSRNSVVFFARILFQKGVPPSIAFCKYIDMGVSENSGTPKSSILIGFSIINHPFWGTPIFGNTHIAF